MIDKVILYDIKLGNKYISNLQAKQILGRAGRTYNRFQQGQTYIFGKSQDENKINQIYYGQNDKVNSNLNNLDKIAFHILPDIKDSKIKTISDIKKWYQNTLSFYQGNNFDENDIYKYLIDSNCIDGNFNLKQNGNLSIQYYYTPNRINVLQQKLDYLIQQNDFSIMAFSWLFSYYSGDTVFHPFYMYFQDQKLSKYYLNNNQNFDFFVYFCIFNGKSIKKIISYQNKTRKDLHRLFAMFKKMCKFKGIDIDNSLKLIENMLYYNVGERQALLMQKLNCYDRSLILKLSQFEIESIQDLQFKIDYIENFFDKNIFQKCSNLLKENKKYE